MAPQTRLSQISLAVLIASVTSLAMLVLAVVLVGQSFHGLESARLKAANTAANQIAVSVDDRIRSLTAPPATALSLLSHDPIAGARSLEQRMSRLPVIADALTSSRIASAVYVGYGNGDFFLLRSLPNAQATRFVDAPPGSRYLVQSIASTGNGNKAKELVFLDRHWNIVARRVPQDYDYDPRSRVWYQTARVTDRTQLSPPYEFFTTGETGLTLSKRSDAHQSAGAVVFGIDVTISDLSDQLMALRQTPGTLIAIIKGEQEVLAQTHSTPEGMSPILSSLLAQPKAPSDQLDTLYFEAQNQEWWGVTEPLTSLGEANLRIAVAIPSDELLADVWASLRQQTLFTIPVAIVLLGMGWILGRQVGRPLERLTDRVEQLSKFQFDTSVGVDSRIREARHLSVALDDMASTIRSFQSIATVLNRGQDLHHLLQDILTQIIQIVGQRRGAVYLAAEHGTQLKLSVDQHLNSPSLIKGIDVHDDDNDIIRKLREQIPGHPVFAILRNRGKKLIGALVIELEHGDHVHLTDELIVFVDEIAGSAAVAIETRELIETQQALLEGFIKLVASAIDAKSPYTGGHCERVPKLAQMMVDEAISTDQPDFAQFNMTDDEKYEFHLAAWLHDCGKITSAEYIVDKAVKLETIYNRIHEVRTRFEVLHRDAEIRYLQKKLDGEDPAQAQSERDCEQEALQADFETVATANTGAEFMDEEDIDALRRIASRTWQRHFSDRLGLSGDEKQSLEETPESELPATEYLLADKPHHIRSWGERVPPVTKDDPNNRWGFDMKLPEHAANIGELHNLTIQKGTLTPEERFRINDHIVQTICMLDSLPLPDWLARVPRLAGTHHERIDGQGYPCKLTGEELSIPERIMAVADVFEALTAVDRPYKDGKTLTESLTIMSYMVKEGHLDKATFELFIRSGIYRRYGEQFLLPYQCDEVDESRFVM